MRIPALIAAAAIAAGLIHGAVTILNKSPAAAVSAGEKPPQQRIDEVFDELGYQRRPLPPGWQR